MGYRRMTLQDIKTIYRRWKAGQSISKIEAAEGITRKTIRKYIQLFQAAKWDNPTDSQLAQLLTPPSRSSRTKSELEPLINELRGYIMGDKALSREPMKPKTAYLVLLEKYDLSISYESFKIFVRKHELTKKKIKSTITAAEPPPGEEIQIDYGKVGKLYDPETNRNRNVQAFGGILSSSRLPFVQFVFSMDQESFIQSHVDMFKYYQGVPQYLTIDNLKTGVLKPEIYDPVVNRAYADMAEHYDTFINPCRVADPKGKPKIERIVPVLRELFLRLKTLNPTSTLAELNKEALIRCREELGMRIHRTTGESPYLMFIEEQKALKPLPDSFEIPHWKDVLVGLDQFFQFEKKFFSLPIGFIRKKVKVCRIKKLVNVFYDNELIREYVLSGKRKYYYKADFPDGINAIVEGTYTDWLLKKASGYGCEARKLIEHVLQPEAALNARRARGMLSVMESHCSKPDFHTKCLSACSKRITTPATFKKHLELDSNDMKIASIKISDMGQKMARDEKYYFSQKEQ